MMKSNTGVLAKPFKSAQIFTATAILLGCGLYSAPKAAPGFDVGGIRISPTIGLSYGRVIFGNQQNFRKSVQNAVSPSTTIWQQTNTTRTADTALGSLGLQVGNYFNISTAGMTPTNTNFKGTSTINGASYTHKFSYHTQLYQIVKLAAGYPLFSKSYYPFIDISANYECINAKYDETDFTNDNNFSGSGKTKAVLPGIGLGIIVNLPKTHNHLGMKFEYEYIAGRNTSMRRNIGGLEYQLLNRIPHRNQLMIGLQYTI